jgi:ATP-dependent helicase HepA
LACERGQGTSAVRAAIQRRGDMALPPFHRSIWLDRELVPVNDHALLARLSRPYAVEPDRTGAIDLNLNARRWQRLMQMPVPELGYWQDLCKKARVAAEDALRTDPSLVDSLVKAEQRSLRVDLGRAGQLRARARAAGNEQDEADLAFEECLAAAIRDGLRMPRIRVDTVGAVFLSASRPATERVSGGS